MNSLRDQLAPLIVAAGGQSAVARASGMTQGKISRYLAGKGDITTASLQRLAEACGATVRIVQSGKRAKMPTTTGTK